MPSDINTNVRLFDLVRYARHTLHRDNLITDEEYAWLCMEAPLAKGPGSPSPRRLEDYDAIRVKMAALCEAGRDLIAACPHEGEGPRRAAAADKMRCAIEAAKR